jgi:hypothetical protein
MIGVDVHGDWRGYVDAAQYPADRFARYGVATLEGFTGALLFPLFETPERSLFIVVAAAACRTIPREQSEIVLRALAAAYVL